MMKPKPKLPTPEQAAAIKAFGAAVTAEMARLGTTDRRTATTNVARRDPELHRNFIRAANPGVAID